MFPYKGKNHDIVFDLEIPNPTQSDRPRDAASELVLALTLALLKLELSAHEMSAESCTYKRQSVKRLAKPYHVHDSTCLESAIFCT